MLGRGGNGSLLPVFDFRRTSFQGALSVGTVRGAVAHVAVLLEGFSGLANFGTASFDIGTGGCHQGFRDAEHYRTVRTGAIRAADTLVARVVEDFPRLADSFT